MPLSQVTSTSDSNAAENVPENSGHLADLETKNFVLLKKYEDFEVQYMKLVGDSIFCSNQNETRIYSKDMQLKKTFEVSSIRDLHPTPTGDFIVLTNTGIHVLDGEHYVLVQKISQDHAGIAVANKKVYAFEGVKSITVFKQLESIWSVENTIKLDPPINIDKQKYATNRFIMKNKKFYILGSDSVQKYDLDGKLVQKWNTFMPQNMFSYDIYYPNVLIQADVSGNIIASYAENKGSLYLLKSSGKKVKISLNYWPSDGMIQAVTADETCDTIWVAQYSYKPIDTSGKTVRGLVMWDRYRNDYIVDERNDKTGSYECIKSKGLTVRSSVTVIKHLPLRNVFN